MKQSALNEWILALESGKIPQMKGRLGDDDGPSRCCLGVYCDVAKLKYGYYNKFLPISELRDFYSEGGDHRVIGSEPSLAAKNDDGMSFDDIAAILRTRPLDFIRTIDPDVPPLPERTE